jgi:hypothetical protein
MHSMGVSGPAPRLWHALQEEQGGSGVGEREPHAPRQRPDGDVELAGGGGAGFEVPPCPACGGVLKPNVV